MLAYTIHQSYEINAFEKQVKQRNVVYRSANFNNMQALKSKLDYCVFQCRVLTLTRAINGPLIIEGPECSKVSCQRKQHGPFPEGPKKFSDPESHSKTLKPSYRAALFTYS